jgi:hypothetical protein
MLERLFPQQADDKLFVEDVFSTWLYTGNGSTQTITNGIDLAGKGGMLWRKSRGVSENHFILDTVRGTASYLESNTTSAAVTGYNWIASFNSDGFTNNNNSVNSGPSVSWTFRKAPKFFDVVTYTGNGSTQTIAHSLGVAPGFILVKPLAAGEWHGYHRSLGATQDIQINYDGPAFTFTCWDNTEPTSTNFTVKTNINSNGATYVAYLFAHVTGSDGFIQCGSYTGNGSATGPVVTLGWEPQWVMIKGAQTNANWIIYDNMRGMPVGSNANLLFPNTAGAEISFTQLAPSATGFQVNSTSAAVNDSGATYIYMAIRRGPMRTPTLGTSVFSPVANSNAIDASTPVSLVPPASDLWLSSNLGGAAPYWQTRLMGWAWLRSSSTSTQDTSYTWTQRTQSDLLPSGGWWSAGTPQVNYFFRRAPGFMDVVCYTGNGVARTITHNLGVPPELIIIKARTNGGTIAPDWTARVPALGATSTVFVNLTDAAVDYQGYVWNNTNPTSTGVSLSSDNYLTNSATGSTYVMYLFASVPGVSKVGTYTGNGSSQTINCAFTTGARFVLIKRTDSTGDWYVWNSARGIVAGNDPYLALNSTAAEVTSNDSVDTDSTGFIVNQDATTNINVNGGTYIYLAIA